jgi:hypothetical protein
MSDKGQRKKSADFEIVDRPPEVETDKPMKEQDILEAMLSDKAIQKIAKTSRGYFTIRYPSGKDRLKIDQFRALRRHGIPAECFDDVANTNNNIWSTLDVTVVDGPDWYKKIRQNNPMWSWEEGPDEELIIELYDLVSTFRADITEKIRKSKFGRTVEESPVSDDSAPMGDGTFSGLANGSKG